MNIIVEVELPQSSWSPWTKQNYYKIKLVNDKIVGHPNQNIKESNLVVDHSEQNKIIVKLDSWMPK